MKRELLKKLVDLALDAHATHWGPVGPPWKWMDKVVREVSDWAGVHAQSRHKALLSPNGIAENLLGVLKLLSKQWSEDLEENYPETWLDLEDEVKRIASWASRVRSQWGGSSEKGSDAIEFRGLDLSKSKPSDFSWEEDPNDRGTPKPRILLTHKGRLIGKYWYNMRGYIGEFDLRDPRSGGMVQFPEEPKAKLKARFLASLKQGYVDFVTHKGPTKFASEVDTLTAQVRKLARMYLAARPLKPGMHLIEDLSAIDPNMRMIFIEEGSQAIGSGNEPGYYLDFGGLHKMLVPAEEQSSGAEAKAKKKMKTFLSKI